VDEQKHKEATGQIRFVTNVSIAANIALSAAKVTIGLLAGSMALLADGIHSLSDMATDLVVLLGAHIGSKEPDQSHPYGHGRAETFAAGFIALVLTFVGAVMIYYAAVDIAKGNVKIPHTIVLAAAVFSIIAKEWLYRITRRVAIKSYSPALYANAWHHRSDALSSVAVVIGFISLRFGFKYGDQLAAASVGLMIILVGVRIIGGCLRELAEGAVDAETIKNIERIINDNSSIHHWHRLRTRTVGREIFLDVHILVDADLNVTTAHQIAEGLEASLSEQIVRPVNITVHIEPDLHELRR